MSLRQERGRLFLMAQSFIQTHFGLNPILYRRGGICHALVRLPETLQRSTGRKALRISLRTRDFDEALRRKDMLAAALERFFQSCAREQQNERRGISTAIFDLYMYEPYIKDLGSDLSWMNKPSDNYGWDYRRQESP